MGELYRYRHCIVCGEDNPVGLNIEFFEGDGFVYGETTPGNNFEGYGDALHGGIISTLLDEVMVKALFAVDIISVTMEITIRFRKPVKIGQKLIIKGYPGKIKSKVAFASGQIELNDGAVAAEGKGKFYVLKGEEKRRMLADLT